ncbi:MAG: hypothetical protein GY847_18050 [Proteobacteria bacterium]|nr:hypothetical protein [Pseudomonadota bacterium]
MPDRVSALLQMIDITWKDIHHNRNQDWKFWVVFAGICAGIYQASTDGSSGMGSIVVSCLLALGAFFSITAALISLKHWDILYRKSAYAEGLETLAEKELDKENSVSGISLQNKFAWQGVSAKYGTKTIISVSGVIFSIYVTLTFAAFTGLIFQLFWSDFSSLFEYQESNKIKCVFLISLVRALIVFVTSFICSQILMNERHEKYRTAIRTLINTIQMEWPSFVLTAQKETLIENIKNGKDDRIELIGPNLKNRTVEWTSVEWKPATSGKRPVLLVPDNYFEFYFEKQVDSELHSHSDVYEIYISDKGFEVSHQVSGNEKTLPDNKTVGCAIIPPGVLHRVTAKEPIYSFQASADGITKVTDSSTQNANASSPDGPSMFYTAETDTLDKEVKIQGNGSTKLVAPKLWKGEVKWTTSKWKLIDQKLPVLEVSDNYFEFSFTTEKAKQEWHTHSDVFEIYISASDFVVKFKEPNGKLKREIIENGCAIIPPDVAHCVDIKGPTYVFQSTAEGITKVGDSKR